jgi:hypothetical protein
MSSLVHAASVSFDMLAGAIDRSELSKFWPALDEEVEGEASTSFILG